MNRLRPRRLVAALVVAGALAGPVAASNADDGESPDADDPATLTGTAAVRELGDRLDDVAADLGWSKERLRRELTTDPSIRLTEGTERPYVVDLPDAHTDPEHADPEHAAVEHADPEHADAAAGTPLIAAASLADTFTLHSKPGASRRIYLDATGHSTSGTPWNDICDGAICDTDPIVSAPFDIDANPGSFSDTELAMIQGIWARMADDFDMFDVDVTTEEPPIGDLIRESANDARFGQRVVLTSSNFTGSALGVAFIGSFGDYSSDGGPPVDLPAFVFSNISGQPYGVTYSLAHGASHEVGHTLGLAHDGLANPAKAYHFGSTGWGPIMGGAGIAQYVTWSRGEYAFANNFEDDLGKMAGNGITPSADTVGNSTSFAAPLTLSLGVFGATGRIETAADTDVYSFDAAGALQVAVTPTAPYEPNLDLELALLDSNGAVVEASNPSGRAAPTISRLLPAGRYYLRVDGVGQGNPTQTGGYSDYASLGSYQLTGSVAPTDPVVGFAPTAAASAANVGPLTVAFSSAGTSDPEGQPLTYQWSFGDGNGSSEANPTYIYGAPGTYSAQLVVLDVGGQPALASTVVVVADPAKQLKVASITATRVRKGTVKVTVKVVDGYGQPVRRALVRGTWTGQRTNRSAYTSSKGTVTFFRYTRKAVEFNLTKVSRTGRVWDGAVSSAAVAAAS